MNKYEVEYVITTTHKITVDARTRDEASELANEIDLSLWTETDCDTVDYTITNLTDKDGD